MESKAYAKQINETAVARNLLEPLTSFRFIAALFVFVHHSQIFSSVTERLQLGYVGVSFFFVLSGFILTYAYYSKLKNGSKHRIASFYISRVAKLYPLHLVILLFALPAAIQTFNLLFPDHTTVKFLAIGLAHVTLLQSFIPNLSAAFAFNTVAWSISTELFFYMLFPALVYMLHKYRSTFTLTRIGLGLAVSWILLIFLIYGKDASVYKWLFYSFPPMRLLDFSFGIFLGLLFLNLQDKQTSWWQTLNRKYFHALEVGAVMLICCGIVLMPYTPQSLHFGLFMMPFCGLLIFIFAWKRGFLSSILSWKPLLFLGNASFSFYMIHYLIWQYVYVFHIPHTALVSFCITLPAACIMYVFFEEPARLRVKSYLEVQLASAIQAKRFGLTLRLPRPQKYLPLPSFIRSSITPDLND
jgi:peptidoglycan/LPS O-acetylase OafA/YrhL